MIYFTGDAHSAFKWFQKSIFPEQKQMTKEVHWRCYIRIWKSKERGHKANIYFDSENSNF